MTRYFRRGHYRTNANGTVSWVKGHTAFRSEWANESNSTTRNSPPYTSTSKHPNNNYNNIEKSCSEPPSINLWSNRKLTHNARCPVCKEAVYFYRNENGSAVFFDEIGPPWTKHPCTSGDIPPLFIDNEKYEPTTQSKWEQLGWKALRSTSVFTTRSGMHGVAGYSKGSLFRFVFTEVSAEPHHIKGNKKSIWHYRITDEIKSIYSIGVFTQSEQFYEFAAKPLEHANVNISHESTDNSKLNSIPQKQFHINQIATFKQNQFLSKPNATCKLCNRQVFVYQSLNLKSLLAFDEEGPPWSRHDCRANSATINSNGTNQLPPLWKQLGWRRFLFRGLSNKVPPYYSIVGFSGGQRIVLSLPGITEYLMEKLASSTVAYFHYRKNTEDRVKIGVYIPEEKFIELDAFICESNPHKKIEQK